jgi:hypothetical protein
MNGRRTLSALLAAGVLAGAAAGCGSSSSSDTLSRKQLDAKASTICDAATKQGKALKTPTSLQDANVAAAYFDKAEPIVSGATAKLKKLKPNGDVSADWNAYLKAREASDALLHTIRQKADSKDASGLKDLQKAPALGDKESAAAKKLGAPACA